MLRLAKYIGIFTVDTSDIIEEFGINRYRRMKNQSRMFDWSYSEDGEFVSLKPSFLRFLDSHNIKYETEI